MQMSTGESSGVGRESSLEEFKSSLGFQPSIVKAAGCQLCWEQLNLAPVLSGCGDLAPGDLIQALESPASVCGSTRSMRHPNDSGSSTERTVTQTLTSLAHI